MAWVLLLLSWLPCFAAAASVRASLRRTKLVSETPHSADWFRSLGTDRADSEPVAVKPVTLSAVKPQRSTRENEVKVEYERPPVASSPSIGLKILQNSSSTSNSSNDTAAAPPILPVLREVTGNLTCPDPGCAADVLLQVYNPQEEYARDCNLSLSVHATDFDDNFEGERVMNFMGNSRALGHDCYPEVNGCVSNQSRELLFPCIHSEPVSTILTDEGNMLVSAQIPHNVDECPFKGNLLHGVTTIACFVGNLADLTTTTSEEFTTTTTTHWLAADQFSMYPDFVQKWLAEHPGMSLQDMPGYESILNMTKKMPVEPVNIAALPFRRNLSGVYGGLGVYGVYGGYGGPGGAGGPGAGGEDLGAGPVALGPDGSFILNTSGFLRCAEKGCKTNLLLDLNRTVVSINKCTLQLWVNQTDFDNTDGAVELLTIKVAGQEVLDKVKPGKNPCRSAYDGHPLKLEEIQMHAVQDLDITEAVRLGPVSIAGEISKQVDECPSNGYLLDSSIQVSCNVLGVASLLEQDKVSVADVMTLNKALLQPELSEQDEGLKEFMEVARVSSSDATNATNASINATSVIQK